MIDVINNTMKTSEIYRLAQGAVLTNTYLSIEDKLQILRELMAKEDIAIYCEDAEESAE